METIPAEALGILVAALALGVLVAIAVFFSYHSGTSNILDLLLGFFR